jgi:hypothetical protein
MLRHGIHSDQVRLALASGEKIEEYPDDEPYPSYLALGWPAGRPLHVVAAVDVEAGETIVITTYWPDPDRWEGDFKTRRPR